jgi:hypothetical protein
MGRLLVCEFDELLFVTIVFQPLDGRGQYGIFSRSHILHCGVNFNIGQDAYADKLFAVRIEAMCRANECVATPWQREDEWLTGGAAGWLSDERATIHHIIGDAEILSG